MAAHRPLFTSPGLILRNIMKTAQDIYTITIKHILRFQENETMSVFLEKPLIFFFSFILLKYEILKCFHPINATKEDFARIARN